MFIILTHLQIFQSKPVNLDCNIFSLDTIHCIVTLLVVKIGTK